MENLKSTVTFDRSDVETYVLPFWKVLSMTNTELSIFDVRDAKLS